MVCVASIDFEELNLKTETEVVKGNIKWHGLELVGAFNLVKYIAVRWKSHPQRWAFLEPLSNHQLVDQAVSSVYHVKLASSLQNDGYPTSPKAASNRHQGLIEDS